MVARTCLALCALALASAGCEDQRAIGEERTEPRPAGQPASPVDLPPRPVEILPPVERNESPTAERGGPIFTPIEVNIDPASGSTVHGTAVLQDAPGGVRVTVDLTQAPPGLHGIHIHEKGDCSDPQAKSAGDHFAPEGQLHGFPGDKAHHLGDMGNITIGQDGRGRIELILVGANLEPNNPKSLLGRAIILHAERDKGTQPTGDAGGRIACGVIMS